MFLQSEHLENLEHEDLVSIIMPSYNTARYISESIKSVIAQTYQNWELLIVDDCSTDNSDKVIAPYLIDSRIHFFKNEKNMGAAFSRNKALREAKGRWIAFLDSDDLWKAQKLEKQIGFMEENDYHFSYTNYSEIDENGQETGITVTGPKKITKTGFLNYCWPGCLTVMFDSQIIGGGVQVADISKNNDYAMWLIVSKHTDCYLLPITLAYYRRRMGSISNNNPIKMIKWHYRLFRIVEKRNILLSILCVVRNLLCGTYKKLMYVKKQF